VPLGNYSTESLTSHITPWPFPPLNPRSFLAGTVAEGRKSSGAADRRWERSSGGSCDVRGSLAVTSRGGSWAVVAGVGLAACTGDRARRRHVLQPAHGGRTESKCSGSFTGGQQCHRCKELKGGSPCSSVYARRRSDEVRRWQSGTSGEVVFGLRVREALQSSWEASWGFGLDGGGSEWPVHGGRARATTSTPCAEGTPTISCSGGAESERGSTVMASFCFIGTGTGVGVWGRAPERALARQDRSNTCACLSALVQALAEQPNVRISPKILCKVSCMSLGLSSLFEFQVKIWSGLWDMVAPSQVCQHCSTRNKTHVKPCQMVLVWVQNFPGFALGNLAPFCQLDHVDLASATKWTHGVFRRGLKFDLEKKRLFLSTFHLGDQFEVFVGPFWNNFLTISCRYLNMLQLL
jgi:hypothetical protein